MKRTVLAVLLGVASMFGCDQPIPGADEDMVEPSEVGELEEGERVDQEVTHVEEPPRAEEREANEALGQEEAKGEE